MSEPFSEAWCDQVNAGIAAEVASADVGAGEQSSTGVDGAASIAIRVRLKVAVGTEYRGVVTVTPQDAPFVVVEPDSSATECDSEVELPVQVLSRISGRSMVELGKDPWLRAMTRVNSGMDVMFEIAYRNGATPLKALSVPDLV